VIDTIVSELRNDDAEIATFREGFDALEFTSSTHDERLSRYAHNQELS
jgi:hypothetical protein